MIAASFNSKKRTAEHGMVVMRSLFPAGLLLEVWGKLKPCWSPYKNNLPSNDTPHPTKIATLAVITSPSINSHLMSNRASYESLAYRVCFAVRVTAFGAAMMVLSPATRTTSLLA